MRKRPIQKATAVAMLLAALAMILSGCTSKTQNPVAQTAQQDDANAATFSVTLNPAGGTWADGSTNAVTVEVKEGKAIDFAAYTPALEGNDLLGWYQQDGYPWPGARKVSGNVSLQAKWSATQVEATYDLVLTINGENETLEYENGVYQFTHVSSIYGGYAQRAGKYTVYEDELKAAIEADDGSVQRVLYHAGSNYIDATGIIYAEFYNDGEFELFYDYVNAGERTKYCMNTGYWTLAGYTAPFEATPIPVDETGMGYVSAHLDWNKTLVGEEEESAEGDQASDAAGAPDIVTLPGEIIYAADATESETMKGNFYDNGVMAVYMSSYGVNVDDKYLWSFDEEGNLSVTYNGGAESILTPTDDGNYTFDDNYGNTYLLDVEALKAAIREPQKVYTANAVNSGTMFAFFYDNHTVTINFDLSSFGMAGQYHVTTSGQWRIGENGLEMAFGGQPVAYNGDVAALLAENAMIEFPVDENTYAVSSQFYTLGEDDSEAALEEGNDQ